jgi:hypothetical protein
MLHELGDDRFGLQVIIPVVVVAFVAHGAIEALDDAVLTSSQLHMIRSMRRTIFGSQAPSIHCVGKGSSSLRAARPGVRIASTFTTRRANSGTFQLEMRLPIGFVYDGTGRVRLDPDARVQDIVRQLFRTFARTGSASATVKAFRDQGLQFPHRIYGKTNKGDVLWSPLDHTRTLWVLHHPRYAGAYCFGRARTRMMPDGREVYARLPREDWIALIREAHEAYITWEEYEQNLQRLRENAQALGDERQRGCPA